MREPRSRFSASVLKVVPDHRGGAFDLRRRDREALAGGQQYGLVTLQLAGADFGSLQVGEDADRLAQIRGDAAYHPDQIGLLLMASV